MASTRKTSRVAKPRALTAKTADKHLLYEQSVQHPPSDVAFIKRVFKKERGKDAMLLREDFCGTGYLCAEWVKSHPQRKAIGLDLDTPTIAWGQKRHIDPLGKRAKDVSLREGNVLDGCREKPDVITAFNFSYCCLLTRPEMLAYMKKARKNLSKDGIFFLDIHGGPECTEEMEETTRHKDFTYVWDQGPYDAITNLCMRHIHFRFKDGTELTRAFSYWWRPWNLCELRDILMEAGFSGVDVYWEGTDDKGRGNGQFRKRKSAENELSWIAYIVALA